MRKTICICDRCGQEITGVIYSLTCYAEDVKPGYFGPSMEAAGQNVKQNARSVAGEADLCKECKDTITDGVFIV